jgi:Xaa-Pro aminopeptidase
LLDAKTLCQTFLFFPSLPSFVKLKHFQQYLKRQRIQASIFMYSEQSQDPAVIYFTQMRPSYVILLITPQKANLYLSKLDHHPTIEGISVKPLRGWEKTVTLRGKIGINKSMLSVESLQKFKKIGRARFMDVGTSLQMLREQKTRQEINYITKACEVTTIALQALVQELPKKRLKTERDAAFFLEKHFYDHGCEVGFPTIVAMGRNAATPHHITGKSKLKRGFLLIDFGARFKNYNADMTRVLFLGTPNKRELGWYNLLKEAQQAGVDAIKEGQTFTQLDAASRTVLGKYKKNFTHSLGHGIGVEVHESPSFSDKKQTVKKDMVFTIEPGIYFPGKFGLRIEDTILFDGKVRLLTKAGKKLVCIDW